MDKISSSIKRSLSQHNQNLGMLSMGLLLLLISAWLILVYLQYYHDRFYPKTYFDKINVSGLQKEEAKNKIEANLETSINFDSSTLKLYSEKAELSASLKSLDWQSNLDELLEQTLNYSHNADGLEKAQRIIESHLSPTMKQIGLSYDADKLINLIQEFKKQVDVNGQAPTATILSNGEIEITKGQTSTELLVDESLQLIHQNILSKNLTDLTPESLNLKVVEIHPIVALEDDGVIKAKERAKKFLGQKLILTYEYEKIELSSQQLLDLLTLPSGFDQQKIDNLITELKSKVDRPSSDARFIYDQNTLQVTEFEPDKNGLEVDSLATKKIIENFLQQIEASVENDAAANSNNTLALPMKSVPAAISLAQSNQLGIKEVIGFGESWYDHSIPNRVYNVDIATSHITNKIVKPGEEFSFNKAIGEVSDRTGYRNAYIIEGGQTKLAPGGGVCQVSSTLFRSLLNSGVKITRRLPHAYRVSYYEIGNEPGFDATVYSGETDLRFLNDTPAHVLIHCESNSEELYMFCKLYGTSDGRSTEIVNYKKWGATGPLPTVYIPDSSLKPGQLKQIDWAAGGIKSEFTNVIRDKNGEIIREDYYKSSYRSWAAKYLRGI